MQRSANTGEKHAIIRRDSEAFQALHRKIHETFQHRDEGSAGFKAWKAACEALHSFASPMFDVGTGEGLAGLAAGDPELVDWAIAYLEVDPFHFRSGYCKARYIRQLKRLSLSQEDQQRLQVVVLRCLDDLKRAPSYYQRLAASLQSPDFIELIRWRLDSPSPELRERARLLLNYIEDFNRSNRN